MTIAKRFDAVARRFPDRIAVHVGDRPLWSYGDLSRRCQSIAVGLTGRYGLNPGDRVALFMGNCPAYVELLLAAWHAGLAVVPVNARLHPSELDWILVNAGAAVGFCRGAPPEAGEPTWSGRWIDVDGDEYADLTQSGPADEDKTPDEHSLAWLFYTSGTTGRPKGAMLTHRNLLAMTRAFHGAVLPGSEEQCWLLAAPASHGAGLYMLPYLAAGGAVVVPSSGGFDADEFIDLLNAHAGMSAFMAPTLVNRLTDAIAAHAGPEPVRLDHLRAIVCGGAPMYVRDIRRALDVLDGKLVQIYGQGESPMTITVLDEARHRAIRSGDDAGLGSVGTAQPGVEIRIAGRADRPLDSGDKGQILVRGDVVMKGYWDNAPASAEALAGGWLHTGDIGSRDDAGFVTLHDRANDMIISGGMNIYPREVEDVLLRHPRVADAAVLGMPHPEWGESVVAFVVPKDALNAGEAEGAAAAMGLEASLDTHCLDSLSRFKRPRRYLFLSALPRNNYGKVLKSELRQDARSPVVGKTDGQINYNKI